jgi:hypothetical protein
MKKIYTSLLIALLCLGTNLNGFSQSAPVPDLLHYTFDGGTSTLVTNYASAPPIGTSTGTLLGGITQTGAINCMSSGVGSGISATTDYLNTGWTTSLTASWSISFWCSGISTNATLYYVFGDINANSFRCFTNGVAGSTNWILRGGGMTDIYANGGALMTPKMITFVYDQTLNLASSYIDGVLSSTVSQGAVNVSGAGPFKVLGYSSNVGAPAGGLLTDFRVYGSALTATQVAAVYAATSVNAINPPVVSGNTLSCSGQSVTLSATGANTYTWSSGPVASSVVVTPTASTIYTVIGASGNCTNVATHTIDVASNPTVTVNSGTICSGSSFTIAPGGADTYTVEGGNLIVSPTSNITYTVIGTSTAGCLSENTATANINVNPNPTVNAVSSETNVLCIGQSATLTASGAVNYVWNTSATTAVIAVSPSTTTSYTVTGTDANGCSNEAAITQSVSACTGILDSSADGNFAAVYPNPANDKIMVELNQKTSSTRVVIVNSIGQTVYSNTAPELSFEVNVKELPYGVYFIKVLEGISVKETKKLIKN